MKREVLSVAVTFPKFTLGKLVISDQVQSTIQPESIMSAIHRHSTGDWRTGEKEPNEAALRYKTRVLSEHEDLSGTRFFVDTNLERDETVVMLPEEY